MNKKVILEVIKIICTAIVSIASVLFVQSCTTSLNIQKHNTDSKQQVEQKQETSVDSTKVELKFNNNNK